MGLLMGKVLRSISIVRKGRRNHQYCEVYGKEILIRLQEVRSKVDICDGLVALIVKRDQ